MATPHVAGYAAYLLTLDSSLTPATVDSTIKSQSLKNVLSGIRKFTNPPTSIGVTRLTILLNSLRDHQRFGQQRPLKNVPFLADSGCWADPAEPTGE